MADVQGPKGGGFAMPKVKRGFPISPIWIFPIVAVAIGAWLVLQALAQQGPAITITWKDAAGIEEGKTRVKYRDVEVGLVETVDIKEDLSGVAVTVRMEKGAKPFLTENTRFWLVRPRVDISGISGLETLVSGVFIEIDPSAEGKRQREFVGLETPPVLTTDEPGREFLLLTQKLGSYGPGSPIYYRGLEVGKILGHEVSPNRKEFLIHAFVFAPHDDLVRKDTRFWEVSGINVSVGAEGMKLEIESVQALVRGGVAFDTKSDLTVGAAAEAGEQFELYPSSQAVEADKFTRRYRWVAYFEGSVRGLTKGAPVEFKGIRVGEVVDVRLEFARDSAEHRIPVYVDIEPERAYVVGKGGVGRFGTRAEHLDGMNRLIAQGLRARLKSGSLLTGQLLVDLDFHPEEPAIIRGDGIYPEIPTIPSSLEEITRSLTAFLDKIQALPLDELTESLTNTMKGVEDLVTSGQLASVMRSLDESLIKINSVMTTVDQDIAPEAAATLAEAHRTLTAVREAISPDSPLRYDLEVTLQELAAAARSIRLLAEYLESNPNALIYGKGGRPQP